MKQYLHHNDTTNLWELSEKVSPVEINHLLESNSKLIDKCNNLEETNEQLMFQFRQKQLS